MGSQVSWDVHIGHGKTAYVSSDISPGIAHREHNLFFVEL